MRSENSPVGDYAEWLVAQKLNLELEKNSRRGYDATDIQGNRYQIKARRLIKKNQPQILSAIRHIDDFNYLVAVILNDKCEVIRVIKVIREVIEKINPNKNGERKVNASNLAPVEDITSLFVDSEALDLPETGQTMADFFEGYIGSIDSSEIVPDGSDLSENTGRKFKELVLAKHRDGK